MSHTTYITNLLHSVSSGDLADVAAQMDNEPRPYRDASRQNCPPPAQVEHADDSATQDAVEPAQA